MNTQEQFNNLQTTIHTAILNCNTRRVSVFNHGYKNKYGKSVMTVVPLKDVTIGQIYAYITGKWAKEATENLRTMKDHKEAQEFKKLNFMYITPNGTFHRRRNSELKERSELMVIDIDGLTDQKEVMRVKAILLADDYFTTVLLFVSPSGLGLKWIIDVGDMDGYSHKDYFHAVSNYLKAAYHIVVDQSGSDISRACYLPYDPECTINPNFINHTIQTPKLNEKISTKTMA